MKKVRAAVIGVGYLGRFHAQKYAQLEECELIAVVDGRPEPRAAVAAEVGSQALADYRSLLGQIDAVSIVTPTAAHYLIAREFLESGAHVLVEKPITETPEQARELIALAARHGRILQVGHLERFNSAILGAEEHLRAPRFIECHRLAPYKERGTDVSVVLDLMIHDIDIVQTLVGSAIESIDAIGTPVFSEDVDIANARIRFANGCVANATASRVSLKTERKMRIFSEEGYLSADFGARALVMIGRERGMPLPGTEGFRRETIGWTDHDAMQAEHAAFTASILDGAPVLVDAHAGRRALAAAIAVTEAMKNSRRVAEASGLIQKK